MSVASTSWESFVEDPASETKKPPASPSVGDWSSQWDLRSQFIGYTWACQQAGLNVDTVVVRGISILKTKIDSQEAEKIYSDDLRARWLDQLRRDLWRLRRSWDEGHFDYNFGDSCTSYGNCIFLTACSAPKHAGSLLAIGIRVYAVESILKNPGRQEYPNCEPLKSDIEELLAVIRTIVNDSPGKWQEKRDAIFDAASDDEKDSIAEFISWFNIIDDEKENPR